MPLPLLGLALGAGALGAVGQTVQGFQANRRNRRLLDLATQAQMQAGVAGRRMAGLTAQSQRQRINRQYPAALGRAQASAVSRGLGNTTVLNSLQRGVMRDRERAIQDVNQQMQINKLAALQGQYGGLSQLYQGVSAPLPSQNALGDMTGSLFKLAALQQVAPQAGSQNLGSLAALGIF